LQSFASHDEEIIGFMRADSSALDTYPVDSARIYDLMRNHRDIPDLVLAGSYCGQ